MNSPPLSRIPCQQCREDTLHKGGVCVHCGTVYRQPALAVVPRKDMAAMRARKRGGKLSPGSRKVHFA
jgi:hypothetical protein